jgi:hypothetical protein
MKRQKAIIDGSNAAYLNAPREWRPNIKDIFTIARAVVASGRDPVIVIDPSIRSLLVDVAEFEKLLADSRVITVPSGKDIASIVLDMADKLDAVIISTNTYIEYYEYYPWIEERRIAVAIVNGRALLLEDKMKRAS